MGHLSSKNVLALVLLFCLGINNELLVVVAQYARYSGYCYNGNDISGCGYKYEWNSEEGYLFNPYNAKTNNLGYTRHYRINSIGECAEICKGENAEAGEYGNDYNQQLCYCITKAICREPDSRLRESGGKVFSRYPKPETCPKSFCDKSYFYCSKESYCQSKGFHFGNDACQTSDYNSGGYGGDGYNNDYPKPGPVYKPVAPNPVYHPTNSYSAPVSKPAPYWTAPAPYPVPYAAPVPYPVNPKPAPYPVPYPAPVPDPVPYSNPNPPVTYGVAPTPPGSSYDGGSSSTKDDVTSAVVNPIGGFEALIQVYDGPLESYVKAEKPPDELYHPVQAEMSIQGNKKPNGGSPRHLKNPYKGQRGELNTEKGFESYQHIEERLHGNECPESDDPAEPNICPVDNNYLAYAKCFNEPYTKNDLFIPSDEELYTDYKLLFDYGFTLKGDVSENNNFVTNERWPGMMLRMVFHDNTVDPYFIDFEDYIALNMEEYKYDYAHGIEKLWTGPKRYLDTSGGDASLLLCPCERFHPNNNYDQTASRILNAFIRKDLPHLKGYSMMDKYHMSYADFLHNGAQAAVIYLTTFRRENIHIAEHIPPQRFHLQEGLKKLYPGIFRYGRKDACYKDPYASGNEYYSGKHKKIALCGQAELLPGLGLNAKDYDDWFVSRGMSTCNWLALMWTHTTMDNMALECPLKQLPADPTSFADIQVFKKYDNLDHLYFKPNVELDYWRYLLGRGIHIPERDYPTNVPLNAEEEPGCNWYVDGYRIRWPLTRTDCVISLDALERQRLFGVLKFARIIKDWTKTQATNSLYCALQMFGGTGKNREQDCAQIINGEDVPCSQPIAGGNIDEHMFGSFVPNGFITKSNNNYDSGSKDYDSDSKDYKYDYNGGGDGGGYNTYGQTDLQYHKTDDGGSSSYSSTGSDQYNDRTGSYAASETASVTSDGTTRRTRKTFYSGIVAICATTMLVLGTLCF